MANELKIFFDPSQAVTAQVYDETGTVVGTPAISESPAASGKYFGDMPALGAGTYTVVCSSGGYVVGSERIFWDGSAVISVPTINSEVNSILDDIASSGISVTLVSPVNSGGAITLIRGDDYKAADGRAVNFSVSGLTMTGATAKIVLSPTELAVQSCDWPNQPQSVTVAGSVSGSNVTIDIPANVTSSLIAGDPSYLYWVIVTLADGNIATVATGSVTVQG